MVTAPLDKSALVVLSGGQDSTTCLFIAKNTFKDVHAVTFDYGQRHKVEIESAVIVAGMAGVSSHEVIEVGPILKGTSPLTDSTIKVEQYENVDSLPGGLEKTFVPGRNLLFLAIAANRAYVLGCQNIFIGVSQEDFGGYPDCRLDFILAMQNTIALGFERPIQIRAPLISLTKAETVRRALGLVGCMEALAYTHTCYNGETPPCGSCHACLLRQKGFDAAGIEDPLLERLAFEYPPEE